MRRTREWAVGRQRERNDGRRGPKKGDNENGIYVERRSRKVTMGMYIVNM